MARDGKEKGRYKGVGVVEISKIFAMQDDCFPLERNQLMDIR